MEKSQMLSLLAEKVSQCSQCEELCQSRNLTVPGEGSPQATVMLIGEAPGQQEDETGRPFVGPAGQLLNNLIKACGWKREEIFITNTLKCRPPRNRTPEPAEKDNCRPFLDLQIKIINPPYIVCLGSVASQNLLRTDKSISDLRGQIFQYNRAKVVCTFHPSYLLRNPGRKQDVWEDMQMLKKQMEADNGLVQT